MADTSGGDYPRLGDNWIGGLYGNVYGPVSTSGVGSGITSDPYGSDWGQGGDSSWTPGETPSTWGQENGPDSFYAGDDSGNYSGDMGYTNQMDYNSDMGGGNFGYGGYPATDMANAGGGESGGGFTQTLYDILNSKGGRFGTGLLSLIFPQLGLPLAATRAGLGMATGHTGETLGGIAGGLAQSALGLTGPASWMLGQAGVSLGGAGASLGRMYDNSPSTGGNSFTPSGAGGGNNMFPVYNAGGTGANGSPVGGGMQPTGYGGGGGSNDNFGSLGAGLGTMYMGNRAVQQTQGQINNLQSLYGPNSPYAQQMQKTLERQDAASGRRSQYGTRAVELQARLADNASRLAPTIADLYKQRQNNEFAKYAAMYGLARNAGAFDPRTYQNLGSMFNQPSYQGSGMTSSDPYMSDWGMGEDTGFGG